MAKDNRMLGVLAMWEAIGRSRKAEEDDDRLSFFSSTAEAVWWTTMLDEVLWPTVVNGLKYEKHRYRRTDGRLLLGLRYARNRQVHDADLTGMHGNPLLKLEDGAALAGRRVWRDFGDPEVPHDYEPNEGTWGPIQESVYKNELANKPVVESLQAGALFLDEYITNLPEQG